MPRTSLPAHLVSLAVGAALVLLAAAPARAAGPDVTCLPERPAPGSTVDCWFDEVPDLDGTIQVDVDGEFDDRNGRAVCRREGGGLRCPDIAVFRPADGGREVTADLVGRDRRSDDAITIPLETGHLGVRLRAADHALVSSTRPWLYGVEADATEGDLVARFVPRWETDPVAELELDLDATWSGPPAEVTLETLGLEPGVYRATLCRRGADACHATGRSKVVQVASTEVAPLDPERADARRDRIDLVVATYGFSDPARAREAAEAMLRTDLPVLADLDTGELLTTDEAEARVAHGERIEVAFGPFAIDPLRQLRERVNVWYLDTPLAAPDQLRHATGGDWAPVHADGFVAPDGTALDEVSVATIALAPDGITPPPSKAAENAIHEHPDISREELAFSGSTTWIPEERPWTAATTLAHELGHALFGLRDEYPVPGGYPRFGFPNCAETADEAAAWWGDLDGEVDPMVDRYLDVLDRFTPDLLLSRQQVERWVRIGTVQGGCTQARDGDHAVYKPSERSLMNREIAVLGSVNRRRVETILGLYSGEITNPSPSAATPTPASPTPAPTTPATSTSPRPAAPHTPPASGASAAEASEVVATSGALWLVPALLGAAVLLVVVALVVRQRRR